MKKQFLKTTSALINNNIQPQKQFTESVFAEFIERQGYSKKHRRNLIKGFRLLEKNGSIDSVIAGFKDQNHLRKMGLELRKKYEVDNAKIVLTTVNGGVKVGHCSGGILLSRAA